MFQFEGLASAAKLYQNWPLALFYVVAELYSSVSISVLFWQFANREVPLAASRRFYPLFGQVSSLAPVLAGQYVRLYAARDGTTMTDSMHKVTAAVCFCGVAMMVLHHTYTSMVNRENALKAGESAQLVRSKKQAKPKLSLGQSLRFLTSSKYLGQAHLPLLGLLAFDFPFPSHSLSLNTWLRFPGCNGPLIWLVDPVHGHHV